MKKTKIALINYNKFILKHAKEYLKFPKEIKIMQISQIAKLTQSERFSYNYLCFNTIDMGFAGEYTIRTNDYINFAEKLKAKKEDSYLNKYKGLKIKGKTKGIVLALYGEDPSNNRYNHKKPTTHLMTETQFNKPYFEITEKKNDIYFEKHQSRNRITFTTNSILTLISSNF